MHALTQKCVQTTHEFIELSKDNRIGAHHIFQKIFVLLRRIFRFHLSYSLKFCKAGTQEIKLKVGGHDNNFLDSLSHLIEIGPTDLRMTPNTFGAIKCHMATYTDQDTDQDIQ